MGSARRVSLESKNQPEFFNIDMSKKGYKQTEEHKEKLKRNLVNFKSGQDSRRFKKNDKHSLETRLKMSVSQTKRTSEGRNPLWRGGIADYPYSNDWTETLRESIRMRDSFTCQECGIHQEELPRNLDIHHIDYNKDNCNPKNLVALCRSCHIKTNYNRDYWYSHFTQ